MQKRIYITIDLPDNIKEGLMKEESRWKNLRVFWTGFSHYKLVLEYLGLVDRDGLNKIQEALDEVTEDIKVLEIRLDRVVLGPNAKEPKMFWATIFEDGAIREFRKKLREKLAEKDFEFGEQDFTPHIVLATAKGNQLKGKQPNVHLHGKFSAENLNLFSSQTYAKNVTKFKLLGIFPLQKK